MEERDEGAGSRGREGLKVEKFEGRRVGRDKKGGDGKGWEWGSRGRDRRGGERGKDEGGVENGWGREYPTVDRMVGKNWRSGGREAQEGGRRP